MGFVLGVRCLLGKETATACEKRRAQALQAGGVEMLPPIELVSGEGWVSQVYVGILKMLRLSEGPRA